MTAAAPTVDAGAVAPAKKGKKKLIVIAAVALVVLLGGAAATVVVLKKKTAAAQGVDDAAAQSDHAGAKFDATHPPIFLPLEPFVVNLADRDADRYAQIGITMELADAKFADEMKAYMPAIRNAILMILAHKDSHELLERAGKERLARQIQSEAARTMGLDVAAADDIVAATGSAKPASGHDAGAARVKAAPAEDASAEDDEPAPKASPTAPAKARVKNPIRHVHFSNFIVQ